MGENVWDFRKRLTLLFGSAVIIAVVFFIFKVLFYYVWPFMLAFCFAVLLQKPIVGLAKLLREKKTLAASIVVTMVTLIILSVLLYVGYMAFRELKDFIANFDENINSLDGQFKLVCCRIDGWIKLKEGCSYAFFEKCKGIIIDGDGQQMFFTIMRKHSVPVITWCVMAVAGLVVCFIGTIYAAAGIEKYRSWRENTIFKDEVGAVHVGLRTLINVYFRVQLIIMSINIVVCSTAFLMIGNPYAILLGVLTGIIDALPIFGTGTVLIPWAVGSLLFGHVKNAVILVVLYIVTYFVREIMESKCMGDRMGIAPFTMLAARACGTCRRGPKRSWRPCPSKVNCLCAHTSGEGPLQGLPPRFPRAPGTQRPMLPEAKFLPRGVGGGRLPKSAPSPKVFLPPAQASVRHDGSEASARN
mgnify:CR=1 FL=1